MPCEDCVDSTGMASVFLNAASVSDSSSFVLDLFCSETSGPMRTLVDCGSSHNFVDPEFINGLGIPTSSIPPLQLRLFDGSSNQIISRAITLSLHFPSGEVLSVDFLVTPLDKSVSAVLGYRWLSDYNPLIDWQKHSIQFRSAPSVSASSPPSSGIPPSTAETPVNSDRSVPSVSLVNAIAFARTCSLPGSESFQLNLSALTMETVQARRTNIADSPPDLNGIPKEYHDYADVFSKGKADTLPEH